MPAPIRQSDVDACPGALRLHAAADGSLARVRLPGGMLTGAQLAVLADLAQTYGDGCLELTSRANIQLRALTAADPAELAASLAAAGMLPKATHEVVRNIAAPPLAGPEIRNLVRELDRALCADPELAGLPGRFLFAVGGTTLAADVAAIPTPPGPTDVSSAPARGDTPPERISYALVLAGHDSGVRVEAREVVGALLAAAHAFLAERASYDPKPWRLGELPDGPARVAARLAPTLRPVDVTAGTATFAPVPDGRELVGIVAQPDSAEVAVAALVPLGRLTRVHLRVLARADRLAVTPTGGVVVADLAPDAAHRWVRDLREAGLAVEPGSRWAGVTTCAGRPGCAKALADVRADAAAAARFVDGLAVHWVGCARGCGSPAGAHVRVEATGAGYVVSGGATGEAGTARPGEVTSGARDTGLGDVVAAARRV